MRHDEIHTLADMSAFRSTFLATPGCDVDFDGVAEALGQDELDDDVLLSTWFDALVERFVSMKKIAIYRHMTVPDFDAYVAALDHGDATLGSHWSASETTWSSAPEQCEVDILLHGSIRRDQICWLSTFQQHFSHPNEAEIVFEGGVEVDWIRELATDRTRTLEAKCHPTFVRDVLLVEYVPVPSPAP